MSVDVVEDLVYVYRGATPQDITATQFGLDIAYTLAEIFAMAEEEVSRLARGATLSTATGAFVDLHLKDRGLRRQDGETDAQAIARMQRPPQAGTLISILEALQLIIGDIEDDGEVFIIELPLKSFYFDRNFCFDRGHRFGGGRGVVIALIPASANAIPSVTDALRTKVSAGKIWFVQEYTVS